MVRIHRIKLAAICKQIGMELGEFPVTVTSLQTNFESLQLQFRKQKPGRFQHKY